MRNVNEAADDALSTPLGEAKPREKVWTELDERAARRRLQESTATPGIVIGSDGRWRTNLPPNPTY